MSTTCTHFDVSGGPFGRFTRDVRRQQGLRAAITSAYRRPEPDCLRDLLPLAELPPVAAARATERATHLVSTLRGERRPGAVEGLVREYALSSQEGVALMCLAEALLRVPDTATRDALIRDKIATGDWRAHVGHSPSLFVNAATWGLVVTGKLTASASETGLGASLTRLIARGGEPVIREGLDLALRMMGEQFVTGQTIAEALANSRDMEAKGFRYSYDMLGEAAVTAADAARYLAAYEDAIDAIGEASAGRGIYEGPGISIKLSALHPRYGRAKLARVMGELLPRVKRLALLARQHDIGLNIDAEEADRLDVSLDILEALALDPDLTGWNGIGFVLQAYGKRCPAVIDWTVDLARRSGRRIMVRLVKGAYWDSEIKRAQVDGMEDFPVFTRKLHTDVSFLACARKLLAAPDAVFPQFATHNAHTLAAIVETAGPNFYPGQYEFQCLHGMGEPLYEEVVGAAKLNRPCRIYAPVGTHETLLAYLVRRLLENGANSSFVNRIADATIPAAELAADPVAVVRAMPDPGSPHPAIRLPGDLFGTGRRNSAGLDLADEDSLMVLARGLEESAATAWTAAPGPTQPLHAEVPCAAGPRSTRNGRASSETPLRGAPQDENVGSVRPGSEDEARIDGSAVLNPADHADVVGTWRPASPSEVEAALEAAAAAAPGWAATPAEHRAALLRRAADALQGRMPVLIGLLVREAGKSYPNAIAEVREAVDFLRYYAAEIVRIAGTDRPPALGVVACISPWNFPLAIFAGQVAAALAAGNAVLAKPAEETPLVAAEAVRLLHEAGVPADVLRFVPGDGAVGEALVSDPRVTGVMFTGSTDVARLIGRRLAARLTPTGQPIPFVAETGGQNAMIVDSSALAEQVVGDVIASAFDSAGQRCSALRIVCLQEDVADRTLLMLKGAVEELTVGNPALLAVDVGPVITAEARDGIERHVATMAARGHRVFRLPLKPDTASGTFVSPTLIEIARIADVEQEVFGPVLHVLRFRRQNLDRLVDDINGSGYGLTFGIHTRIDETVARVMDRIEAGNIYVNRNVIGAVVGVQPFGGSGLSGTGPKAGGPLYVARLLHGAPRTAPSRPQGVPTAPTTARAYADWLRGSGRRKIADRVVGYLSRSALGTSLELPGPVGERNVYSLRPRGRIAALAGTSEALLIQVGAILATGNVAVVEQGSGGILSGVPKEIRPSIELVRAWNETPDLRGILFAGESSELLALSRKAAGLDGPIMPVQAATAADLLRGHDYDLTRLLEERTVSTNTAAAGGNPGLMATDL